MKFYKIRDLSTGLYSSGGIIPTWDGKGKVWKSIGILKSHLTLVTKYPETLGSNPNLWEVVELNVVEGERYGVLALMKKSGE